MSYERLCQDVDRIAFDGARIELLQGMGLPSGQQQLDEEISSNFMKPPEWLSR